METTPDRLPESDCPEQTLKIRTLNDTFRITFEGGQVLMTPGIQGLSGEVLWLITKAIQTFNDFDRENDPYNEHDFGSVEVQGETIFWKIDYYAPGLQSGSEDPADPAKTRRVMTVMLAEEY